MYNQNRSQTQIAVQPPDGHQVPSVFLVRVRLLEPQVSDFSPQCSHFLLAEGKGVGQLLVLLHLRLQVTHLLFGGREAGRHEVQLGAEPDLVSIGPVFELLDLFKGMLECLCLVKDHCHRITRFNQHKSLKETKEITYGAAEEAPVKNTEDDDEADISMMMMMR